ncbi:MAG TPA: acylphosphatase [candidate division Zixibacteria bacterium]|nr:acylphosphatase [candidate division Zixibacteria bacterium]
MSENLARVHLRITGRVQGVFFRASAQREAERRAVTGWVRNRPDGSVEIVAEGERARLDEFISWCRQGPPGARVDGVTVEWETFRGEFRSFRVER